MSKTITLEDVGQLAEKAGKRKALLFWFDDADGCYGAISWGKTERDRHEMAVMLGDICDMIGRASEPEDF